MFDKEFSLNLFFLKSVEILILILQVMLSSRVVDFESQNASLIPKEGDCH